MHLHSLKHTTEKYFRLLVAAIGIAAALGATPASAALGDSTTWYFNLPSTAVPSQNPPYPSVAALYLLETVDGVQFTLTPAWTDPPAGRFGADSHIERLEYVFDNGANAALIDFTPSYPATVSNADFRWDSGAPIKSFDYQADQNMDSGYKAEDNQLIIDFFSKNNDPDAYRFDATFTNSVWTLLGVDLIDFTGTFATHNSHPSPTQGIISVTAYSLEDPKPTPSNWVSGPGPTVTPSNGVPEPATLALLALGLAGIGFSRRKQ